MTPKTLHGIVIGRTIQLTEDPGVPEGQAVVVVVTSMPPQKQNWGDGLRRCAGALANDWSPEDDKILDAIQQERKQDSRPELCE